MNSSVSVKEIMADFVNKVINFRVQKCRELNELSNNQLLFHVVSS